MTSTRHWARMRFAIRAVCTRDIRKNMRDCGSFPCPFPARRRRESFCPARSRCASLRRRPTRRIPIPSDFKAALAAVHITIRNRLEGTLISILVVAEKPSVAMSYAKVLGATSRQDGYLEGNGYLVSWCVGHLVELAPPNVYDAKYVKWSIADLPILPQKWQYLVSTSTKKQFGILQKLMHRPDVESVICATDAG